MGIGLMVTGGGDGMILFGMGGVALILVGLIVGGVWGSRTDSWLSDHSVLGLIVGVVTVFLLGGWLVTVGSGPLEADAEFELVVDASGAAPTGGTPLPDVVGAVLADDGVGPLPLGAVNELPDSSYLNFLSEVCFDADECFRDAVLTDQKSLDGEPVEWEADQPFHIRHGFVNNNEEPLGEGFDLVLYVFPMDVPGEEGGMTTGPTSRYTSDYVLRSSSDQCGPTYRTQTGPETCEWFVHDFPDGLSEGRFALWAVWEAPCSAWLDLGFTDSCGDPIEVVSLFSSGVDSPIQG